MSNFGVNEEKHCYCETLFKVVNLTVKHTKPSHRSQGHEAQSSQSSTRSPVIAVKDTKPSHHSQGHEAQSSEFWAQCTVIRV